jgi:hypothetical protein
LRLLDNSKPSAVSKNVRQDEEDEFGAENKLARNMADVEIDVCRAVAA